MKYLFILVVFLFFGCKSNDTEVKELKRNVDSLTQHTKISEQPKPIEIRTQPATVYAFCIINYDYWYYDGPTFDGTSPKKHTSKHITVYNVKMINNDEDSKQILKDDCLNTWISTRPPHEINHVRITNAAVYTFPTYAAASQAREKHIY